MSGEAEALEARIASLELLTLDETRDLVALIDRIAARDRERRVLTAAVASLRGVARAADGSRSGDAWLTVVRIARAVFLEAGVDPMQALEGLSLRAEDVPLDVSLVRSVHASLARVEAAPAAEGVN